MLAHLPALQVIVPLLTAPLCVLTRNSYFGWYFALVATWFSLVVALGLFSLAVGGPLSYAMGGWMPPIGIEYKVDILNSFVLVIVSAMGAIMLPYAKRSVADEIPEEKQSLFYSAYLLCFAGLLGIVITNDLFNIYVFLEISSLAMYTLIAMGKERRALTASFEYLILGTIGATFILIGIGLLYMVTGTLNISDLAARISSVPDARPIEAALAFLTLGLALKIAMFPLHLWLTNAYTRAPSFVSAFLAATATKVSLYVLIRVLFTLFGVEFSFGMLPLGTVLTILAILGIFVGSFTAVFQTNVKRLLAYSSVAQVGYIMLGLALVTQMGLAASITHMANHAMAKGALFLAVGCVVYRIGSARMADWSGVGKTMPWTMGAFALAGLSLIGIPGTAGFISKWYFILALIEEGHWLFIVVLLVSSLLALVYIGKVLEAAFFKAHVGKRAPKEAPLSMLIPLWFLVLANIYFGFNTSATLGTGIQAAEYLLGASG